MQTQALKAEVATASLRVKIIMTLLVLAVFALTVFFYVESELLAKAAENTVVNTKLSTFN